MPYDARAIANFLLDYADRKGTKVTVMGLIKVIYYGHGWYLAEHDRPLTKQPFEAWQHGPVIRLVWEAFKGSDKPINGRATKFDPVENRHSIVECKIDHSDAEFLRNIFDAYAHIDAIELSKTTHEVGSPWDLVWNAPEGRITLGMRISNELIRSHFLRRQRVSRPH